MHLLAQRAKSLQPIADEDGSHGQTCAQRFAEADYVRSDAVLVGGEIVADAAVGLQLVKNQQTAEGVADFAQALQIALGQRNLTAAGLQRLNDDAGHGAGDGAHDGLSCHLEAVINAVLRIG